MVTVELSIGSIAQAPNLTLSFKLLSRLDWLFVWKRRLEYDKVQLRRRAISRSVLHSFRIHLSLETTLLLPSNLIY